MNLIYEPFPESVQVDGRPVPIITDFREYVRLLDMLKSDELDSYEKTWLISQYFLEDVQMNEEVIRVLTDFVTMKELEPETESDEEEKEDEEHRNEVQKSLFSYSIDYPYILSGFLRDYGIDLNTVEYLHWWKFRMLFNGLSEDTEIKQRIMYRGMDLSTIKDKDERKRIARIQRQIRLPEEALTDYDIGNAFA